MAFKYATKKVQTKELFFKKNLHWSLIRTNRTILSRHQSITNSRLKNALSWYLRQDGNSLTSWPHQHKTEHTQLPFMCLLVHRGGDSQQGLLAIKEDNFRTGVIIYILLQSTKGHETQMELLYYVMIRTFKGEV